MVFVIPILLFISREQFYCSNDSLSQSQQVLPAQCNCESIKVASKAPLNYLFTRTALASTTVSTTRLKNTNCKEGKYKSLSPNLLHSSDNHVVLRHETILCRRLLRLLRRHRTHSTMRHSSVSNFTLKRRGALRTPIQPFLPHTKWPTEPLFRRQRPAPYFARHSPTVSQIR